MLSLFLNNKLRNFLFMLRFFLIKKSIQGLKNQAIFLRGYMDLEERGGKTYFLYNMTKKNILMNF